MESKLDRVFVYTFVVFIWICMIYADITVPDIDKVLFRFGLVGLLTYVGLRKLQGR